MIKLHRLSVHQVLSSLLSKEITSQNVSPLPLCAYYPGHWIGDLVLSQTFPLSRVTRTATAMRTSLKKWIRATSNFSALIPSRLIRTNVGNFLELNSTGQYQSSGKQKESCCLLFPSSTKREIRHFHVAPATTAKKCIQKSVMHVQSCCFASINLLLFSCSLCRRRRRCLSSLTNMIMGLIPWGNHGLHMKSRRAGNRTW